MSLYQLGRRQRRSLLAIIADLRCTPFLVAVTIAVLVCCQHAYGQGISDGSSPGMGEKAPVLFPWAYSSPSSPAFSEPLLTELEGGVVGIPELFSEYLDFLHIRDRQGMIDLLRTGYAKRGLVIGIAVILLAQLLLIGSLLVQRRRRERAEEDLRLSNETLEKRVAERTAQVRDNSEWKKVEEALRESEKRLNRSQQIAHLGSWELDLTSNRLSWSDEVYRIFGLEPQEFAATYEAFLEHVHPDDRDAVNAAYSGSVEAGSDSYEIVHRVIREGSGEIRFVHEKCQHTRDGEGRIVRSLGMVLDITERRQAEDALRESEAKYKKLFNNMVEEVHFWQIIRDVNGEINTWLLVDANPPALKSWGRGTVEEIRGKNADEIFGPGATEHYLAVVRKIMAEGVPYVFEDYFPHLDKHFRFTSVPLADHFITTGADITNIKKAELALRKNSESLERSNRHLEQFAYVASHDLQEPLRAIVGFLQLLESRYEDKVDEKGRHYIERSVKAAHRMQRLIKEFLTLSRVCTQGSTLVSTDLNHLLRGVLENLHDTVQEKKAEVNCGLLPVVNIDAGQIGSLFQNLLVNALRYNRSPRPRIDIDCRELDDCYRFRVQDNGIGIPPQFAQRIFLVFQRLHTEQEYTGTGLGLALCKRIIERHGGTIWVEPGPTGGSIFYFTIPKEVYQS